MSVPLSLPSTFARRLAEAERPLVGGWVSSGSPLVAEIMAGSGLDWVLIDGEHSAIGLESIVSLLHAVSGTPATPVVRVPSLDTVILKQVLDAGAQNVLVPMVDSVEEAQEAVAAVRYPPRGRRGVGSALARSARWNRVADYLHTADEHVSLFVQIESAAAAEAAAEIAAVDGVDGIYLGPADLAGSMGVLGQQGHPEVVALVEGVLRDAAAAGVPAGVNAFDPQTAQRYLDAGARFITVGADVALLARGSEALAERWIG